MGEWDQLDVVMSGVVVNEEQISAWQKLPGSLVIDLSVLSNWQEEADCHIIYHVYWEVRRVVREWLCCLILLLHYIGFFKEGGLQELWLSSELEWSDEWFRFIYCTSNKETNYAVYLSKHMPWLGMMHSQGGHKTCSTCNSIGIISFQLWKVSYTIWSVPTLGWTIHHPCMGQRKTTLSTFDNLWYSVVGLDQLPPMYSVSSRDNWRRH